jgi:hypothetical protein
MRSDNMWTRIGPLYRDFLHSHFPDVVPPGLDGFNLSIMPLQDNHFVCSVRFKSNPAALKGEKVLPGVTKRASGYGNKRIGKNFFWNRWYDSSFIDSTCLFVMRRRKGTLEVVHNIKPTCISNKDMVKDNECNIKGQHRVSDIRLFLPRVIDSPANSPKPGIPGIVYGIDGNNTTIFEIILSKDRVRLGRSHAICRKSCFDKNWAYLCDIRSRNGATRTIFLDWFLRRHVIVSEVSFKKDSDRSYKKDLDRSACQKKKFVPMREDAIDGLGLGDTAMYSFSTPFVKTADHVWVAAGHAKLPLSQPYSKDSKIRQFMRETQTYLHSTYKERYVEHNSYMYLMYFIRVTWAGREWKVEVSDIFLPLSRQPDEHVFSLVYPMSIYLERRRIIVGCGVGDFYAVLLEFRPSDFADIQFHDVSCLDVSKIDYSIRYF